MPKFIDLTGQRFGRLLVEAYLGRKDLHSWFRCKCDCGGSIDTHSNVLRRGLTQSCGCLHLESVTKHGGAKDSGRVAGYESWRMMRQRCLNTNYTQYHDYGGRGIKICPEWESFSKFMLDMGPRPEGMTLERKDVDGDYTPQNCIWATRADQNRNKRKKPNAQL